MKRTHGIINTDGRRRMDTQNPNTTNEGGSAIMTVQEDDGTVTLTVQEFRRVRVAAYNAGIETCIAVVQQEAEFFPTSLAHQLRNHKL